MVTFGFVGICVAEAVCLACFASNEPPQVGASLMLATLFHGVTLGTLLDEHFLAFFCVS